MPDPIEEVVDTEVAPQVDVLDLSDEEFAKLDFDSLAPSEEVVDEVVDDESLETEEDAEDDETESTESTEEDSDEETESTEADKEEDKEVADETVTEDDDTEVTDKVADEETPPDYEADLQKLFTPFKANGKEIKVENVDDAITLMQMGANYNKKMAGLKPNLKLLKMLENNDLLNEEKLNYLIDLDKKDPDAIRRLVKDSEIDPLDIDVSKASEYKPKSYTVDDREVALDGILGEIQDTESYKETIDIISNKWDNSSKEALYNSPDVIKVLNGHVESGVYQQISAVIESERMLGRLQGVTDIQAYQQVGKAIDAQGGFNKPKSSVEDTVTEPVKKAVDPKLKQRKRAASSTKSTVSKKVNREYNPLAMSDAEFEKLGNNQFL